MKTRHHKDFIRREAFVQGFVAARDPKTPGDTLLVLEEADRAYAVFMTHREDADDDTADLVGEQAKEIEQLRKTGLHDCEWWKSHLDSAISRAHGGEDTGHRGERKILDKTVAALTAQPEETP